MVVRDDFGELICYYLANTGHLAEKSIKVGAKEHMRHKAFAGKRVGNHRARAPDLLPGPASGMFSSRNREEGKRELLGWQLE